MQNKNEPLGGLWETAADAGAYGAAFAAARIRLQGLPGKQAAIFKSLLRNPH